MGVSSECEAFVLRLQDYRETDRLVWLLTTEHGRVSAVARAARKSRRRFGGHLDLFHRVHARIARSPRSSLHNLLDCRTTATYPNLRVDALRYGAASLMAELVIELTREEASDPLLFARVSSVFELLDDTSRPVTWPALSAAAVTLLHAAGFVMDLGTCGDCGAELARKVGPAWFDPADGLRCDACARGASRARRLTAGDVGILAAWQRGPLADNACLLAGTDAVGAAMDLMHHTVGRRLRAERFVETLLGPADVDRTGEGR